MRTRTIGHLGLVVAIGAALAAGHATAKDWKEIRVGTEGDYPRFSYTDSTGNLRGWDIDIVDEVCKRLQAKCTYTRIPFDGMIAALLANKIDLISSINISEERKKRIGFTHKHYNLPNRFVTRKGVALTVSKEGLKGKTIGVQNGSVQEKYVRDNFGDVATVKSYTTMDQVNLDLTAGRLDTAFGQVLVLQDSLLDKPEGKAFEFVGPLITDPKWFGEGTAMGLRKEDTDLQDKINAALAAIRADGTYQKINAKNFPFDIYGD
jgi:arginine/ornithine transport system substrate-binding protein